MHGNAHLPSVMAALLGGSELQSYFSLLWTEVHLIKFAFVGVSVVFNAIFRLAISCCFREIFTIAQSCAKSC